METYIPAEVQTRMEHTAKLTATGVEEVALAACSAYVGLDEATRQSILVDFCDSRFDAKTQDRWWRRCLRWILSAFRFRNARNSSSRR